MTGNEQIKAALQGMNQSKAITMLAKVTATDESTATISAELAEGMEIEDIRLLSTINANQGFYILPKVGSQVLLLRISESDEFHAVAFSEFDKVIARNATVSLEVTEDAIIFNNNELAGFLPDLTKLVQTINDLESEINNLKTIFTSWVTVPNDGGAALKAGAATWAGSSITPTTINDLKDPKIKN